MKYFFCAVIINFNPRSREGSDGLLDVFKIAFDSFQSTLPRGERPVSRKSDDEKKDISIHAPARGATIFVDLVV